MGYEVSMKIRVVRMLFVAIFPALVATGCAVAAASQPAPIAVGHVGSAEAVAQAAAPLAECQRQPQRSIAGRRKRLPAR